MQGIGDLDLTSLYPDMGEYGGWGSSGSGGGGNYHPPSPSIWDSINLGIKSASGILSTRYSVPQLNQGQYIQSSPQGTVMFQGGPNTQFGMPSLSNLTSGGSLLPLLLIGGVALLFLKKG